MALFNHHHGLWPPANHPIKWSQHSCYFFYKKPPFTPIFISRFPSPNLLCPTCSWILTQCLGSSFQSRWQLPWCLQKSSWAPSLAHVRARRWDPSLQKRKKNRTCALQFFWVKRAKQVQKYGVVGYRGINLRPNPIPWQQTCWGPAHQRGNANLSKTTECATRKLWRMTNARVNCNCPTDGCDLR